MRGWSLSLTLRLLPPVRVWHLVCVEQVALMTSSLSFDAGVLSFKKERKRRDFGVFNDRLGDAAKIDYKNVEREIVPKNPPKPDTSKLPIGAAPPPESVASQWIESKTTTIEIDCIPEMSQHSVRTAIFEQVPKGVNNLEGYWPPGNKREIRSSLSFQEPFLPAIVCGVTCCCRSSFSLPLLSRLTSPGRWRAV